MEKKEVIEYCMSMPKAEECFPFDDEVMVFKVCGKMFGLINIKSEDCVISLKCDPELAEILRTEYKGVKPGYHLNKKHWNSVDCDSDVMPEKIKELISHSYAMVLKGLTKLQRKSIEESIKAE